jgi:hypothetical protein
LNDLNGFRPCLGQLEANMPPGCECADFDHQKLGPFWVSLNDLNILRGYLGQLEANVPCCDDTQDCVPDLVIYDFWTN